VNLFGTMESGEQAGSSSIIIIIIIIIYSHPINLSLHRNHWI